MNIYEKVERLNAITEEAEVIEKTLPILKIVGTTVNVETTRRCTMIARNLNERMKFLLSEFNELKDSIMKEMQS